jgi:hypothetical protein
MIQKPFEAPTDDLQITFRFHHQLNAYRDATIC